MWLLSLYVPSALSFTKAERDMARICWFFKSSKIISSPFKSPLGAFEASNSTIALSSHSFFGSGAEHFGAITMIATAPANMAAHISQKVMNKAHLNLIQNGSFANFISSSLPIPESTAFTISISILASPFSEINFTYQRSIYFEIT